MLGGAEAGDLMLITIFDYGAGNLHSLAKALETPGASVRVEPDPVRAVETDALVLPGVGAFAQAAERLAPGRDVVRAAIAGGLPTLGICLGMQLLFEESEEGPWAAHGEDRFPAAVRRGGAVGVQFHPEKSSRAGVEFVRAFVAEARNRSAGYGARRERFGVGTRG